MSESQQLAERSASVSPPESAVLTAARQLSEEAAIKPRTAGLTGLRRRDAQARTRRASGRMRVMPAA